MAGIIGVEVSPVQMSQGGRPLERAGSPESFLWSVLENVLEGEPRFCLVDLNVPKA